jgi:hypothetical protein
LQRPGGEMKVDFARHASSPLPFVFPFPFHPASFPTFPFILSTTRR